MVLLTNYLGPFHSWYRICIWCLTITLPASSTVPHTLQQILILSRHGVRGPYGPLGEPLTPTTMTRYSNQNKFHFELLASAWGTPSSSTTKNDNSSRGSNNSEFVTPALTNHGAAVITTMGRYLRQAYGPRLQQNKTVWTHCHQMYLYADNNERDDATAMAFIRGFAPECLTNVSISNDGARALFQQGQDASARCPLCAQVELDAWKGSYLSTSDLAMIDQVSDILNCCAPTVCPSSPQQRCSLANISSNYTGVFYAPYHDRLSTSEYFTEWFLLSALNNMTLDPALGSLENIVTLGALHMRQMNLITNVQLASNFGSTLLLHLLASMEEKITQKKIFIPPRAKGPHVLQRLNAQVVYYAGHDINLLLIQRLLQLQWHTPSWLENQPPPGSMLIFELHQLVSSEWTIELFFVTATPDQIRHNVPLNDIGNVVPERVSVLIPHCSRVRGGSLVCPFSTFRDLVRDTINFQCLSPTLEPYAASLSKPLRYNDEQVSVGFFDILGWMVVLAMALSLLIMGMKFVLRLPVRRSPHQAGHYVAVEDYGA